LAKRSRPVGGGWVTEPKPGDTPLGDFAADLGKFLGGVQSRAASWMEQRKAIVAQLTKVRDTANEYLEQLSGAGAAGAAAFQRARRGRPPGSGTAKVSKPKAARTVKKTGGRRKGFKMSPEAKARIAAAQKKRWAQYRRDQAKKGKGGITTAP
jgi:hypothetical protein